MRYKKIGTSDLVGSVVGLGTQFFGGSIEKQEAFCHLDAALDLGINIIDTAEVYPVPYSASTWGASESIIGEWLQSRKSREKVILATKVVGRSHVFPYIRSGKQRLDRFNIEKAVEGSLKRLQVETIDLYQVHWPDRNTNFFGKLGYEHSADEDTIPIEETVRVLSDLVSAGKIRCIGVCNETPWGMMRYFGLSKQTLPRIASIQYPYNLLNRVFEMAHAEMAMREGCSLLAYSPLAHGTLTGKYLGGNIPSGSRFDKYPFFKRYKGIRASQAAEFYVALARRYELDPAQVALAYVMSRPFVASALVSVSNSLQLQSNVQAVDVCLPSQLIKELEDYHLAHPNPAP